MKSITTPVTNDLISGLSAGDMITLSGYIFTGRDAVLPKIVSSVQKCELSKLGIELDGSVIFHSAVSSAGVGPTSSNKDEIESSIPVLSKAGVKIHLGKGALSESTINALNEYHSVYAVVPPVSALLGSLILEKKVVAFHEEGMEALYQLNVHDFPAVIAVAHGKSLYNNRNFFKNSK